MINLNKKKHQWRWIKGGQGYGQEIINGEGKRVAILDCQSSLWEEHNFGFSIVPKAKGWTSPSDQCRHAQGQGMGVTAWPMPPGQRPRDK